MAVVYVLMYFKCKICFTVYTGETKNKRYLLTYYDLVLMATLSPI